jgi:hypothetical protein
VIQQDVASGLVSSHWLVYFPLFLFFLPRWLVLSCFAVGAVVAAAERGRKGAREEQGDDGLAFRAWSRPIGWRFFYSFFSFLFLFVFLRVVPPIL